MFNDTSFFQYTDSKTEEDSDEDSDDSSDDFSDTGDSDLDSDDDDDSSVDSDDENAADGDDDYKKAEGDEEEEEDPLIVALKKAKEKQERSAPPDIKFRNIDLTDISFHPSENLIVASHVDGKKFKIKTLNVFFILYYFKRIEGLCSDSSLIGR